MQRSEIVSDDAEPLILVDSSDTVLGYLDKAACHDGDGRLHRAFSLFIFNATGELLVQRRAAGKRLWPGYWSNSCCSHPRRDETMAVATQRRCTQELGFATELDYLYTFEYAASYLDEGTERELCSVFVGSFDGEPNVNATEIDEWRWISTDELAAALEDTPEAYTPWFKMEWARLRQDFVNALPSGVELEPSAY